MTKKDLRIFKNIPMIKTPRLILRQIVPADADDVFEYASDPRVSRYLLWSAHKDKVYTRNYLFNLEELYKRGRFFDWGIEFSQKMVGTVGFSSFDIANDEAEIGYVLNCDFWHQGIASEAVRAIIAFGFEVLNLKLISARYMIGNESSRALAKRVGMNENIEFCEYIYSKGHRVKVFRFEITKEDYFNNKSILI